MNALNKNSIKNIELDKFEQLIFSGNFKESENYFYGLLDLLSINSQKSISELLITTQGQADLPHLLTRLSSAIGQVIMRREFNPSIPDLETLMTYQYILSRIFILTPFTNTDYLIQNLLLPNKNSIVDGSSILKAFFLFSTESKLTECLKSLLEDNKELYITTCLMLIWACTGSEQSCANREWAYGELNILLDQQETFSLPLRKVHGFFMHSSYGFSEHKHNLKYLINKIIKKGLVNNSIDAIYPIKLANSPVATINIANLSTNHSKPILLVILEHFHSQHPVYRVLGRSLLACKEHFTVVAIGWPGYVRNLPKDYFDIEIVLSGTGENYCLDELLGIVNHYKPIGVYYPSIGMTPWTIYYSNVRLAPTQFTTVGHGASSFATEIDYFLIEEDIAGDARTYSEKLICLPMGSMPFNLPEGIIYRPRSNSQQKTIEVVCCSSTIKLNTHFLSLCQRIAHKYPFCENQKLVNFTFLLQSYSGLDFEVYRKLILSYLPNAKIHIGLPFQVYLDKLAQMDIALSPFPYGNMNGIVDCAKLGVIGVCMQGPQVHQAIDAGMMRRMGMPDWLIANNEEQYETAVCRLIDERAELVAIRENLIEGETYLNFFNGNPSVFSHYIRRIVSEEFIKS